MRLAVMLDVVRSQRPSIGELRQDPIGNQSLGSGEFARMPLAARAPAFHVTHEEGPCLGQEGHQNSLLGQVVFEGTSAGTGAIFKWAGNDEVGEGGMTITESRAPESVTIRLEFIKPWTATNTTRFDFTPAGAGTNATWTMTGHNNFMAKAMHLFMNMETMVGPDFERGLATLDAVTAGRAKR